MTGPLRAGALSLLLILTGSALSAQAPAAPGLAPLCVPNDHTLCLDGGRFSVTANYQPTAEGPSYAATAVVLTDATGYFWFFDSTNVELIVKVLNGCGANGNNHYWVFAAGLTNVGVQMVVTDLLANQPKEFDNPVGNPFAPIQNTGAFDTCP